MGPKDPFGKKCPNVYMKEHGLNSIHRHFLSFLRNPKELKEKKAHPSDIE